MSAYARFQVVDWSSAQRYVCDAYLTERYYSGFGFDQHRFITRMLTDIKSSPYGIDLLRDAADDLTPYTLDGVLKVPSQPYLDAAQAGNAAEIGRLILSKWDELIGKAVDDYYDDAIEEAKGVPA